MKTLLLILFALSVVSITTYSQAPQLQWVQQIGGSYEDFATSVATDASGNVYTIGNFNGTVDFDPGTGIVNLTGIINRNSPTPFQNKLFISKFDASGNFSWVKTIEGSGICSATSLAVDAAGNLYITGHIYKGTFDFNPGDPVLNISNSGAEYSNIFILKLDNEGNFKWVKHLDGYSYGSSITTDKSGNVYVVGGFKGLIDFDPGEGIYNLVRDGFVDLFILKLDTYGNFKWVQQFQGINNGESGIANTGNSIAVDPFGNVYTTGKFYLTVDFDPGSAKYDLSSSQYTTSIFISKLDSSGNFAWAKSMGNDTYSLTTNKITTDFSGNVYLTGGFMGSIPLNSSPNSPVLSSSGGNDIYIFKLNSSGNFQWAKKMGGSETGYGADISIDGYGNIYTTGFFLGTADFDPGKNIYPLTATSSNHYDVFISKLDSLGNFLWAGTLGTSQYVAMAVDMNGTINIVGGIMGVSDVDPGPGTHYLLSEGTSDIFIEKLTQTPLDVKEPLEYGSLISLSPVPSSNFVTVSFEKDITNGRIKLINLFGQTMFEQSNVNGTSLTLDIAVQPNGMYFIEVNEGGIVERVKLIKE